MLPEIPKPGIKYEAKKLLVSDADIPKNLVISDVARETNRLFWSKYSQKTKILFFGISLLWISFFVYLFFTSQALNNSKDDSEQIHIFFALLPVFLVAGLYASFYGKIEKLFMQQFAASAGLVYVGKGNIDNLSGGIFQMGHGHVMSHIITGVFENHPISLFFYQYTIGSGKQAHTHLATVLNISYDHVLPPVLLLVDNQHFGGFDPSLSLPDPIKLKPELDLDSQFDLYCQKKYEIETLQIFSPDFISKMMGDWKNFNLEFSKNNLVVFKSGKILNAAELNNFFSLAKYLMTGLEKTLSGIAGSVKALNELNPNNKTLI